MTKRPERPMTRTFKLAVIVPTLTLLALGVARNPKAFTEQPRPGSVLDLLWWLIVLEAVELLPVPVSQVLRLSLGFPVLLSIAMLYSSPIVVSVVALVGALDSRELRGEVPLLTALFNRCQLAIAFALGSLTFHQFASDMSPLWVLVLSVLAATVATYGTNVVFVATYMRIAYGTRLSEIASQLRVGGLTEFLISYVGLGMISIVITRLYLKVGMVAVGAFILPLVFARQMFFRTMALERASNELKDREQVLRALSNRMAQERQDERVQIASYLHDDLAQMLFRLTLQAEMAKRRLARATS